MHESKIAPIAGPISIILGIVGLATGIYIIGGFLGIAGLIFGLLSYSKNTSRVITYIGIILSDAAIAWMCIFYILWDSIP